MIVFWNDLNHKTTTVTTGGGGGVNTAAIEAQICSSICTDGSFYKLWAPIAGTVTSIYNEDRQMAIADRPVYDDSAIHADGSIPQHSP